MKALSKPLSSPGRAADNKFPPPLMRFLKSNVGSRSRGRSKSSPMFYLRSKKRAPAVIEAAQEPSSPKVTCIGQVRVRRAASKSAVKRRRCWWLKKVLVCGGKKKPFVRKLFCRCGSFCRRADAAEDSFRAYSDKQNGKIVAGDYRNSESDCRSGSQENEREVLECSSSSPPKNALLLTRCRSAPYRSSSLAGRFWGSQEDDVEKIENGDLQKKPISEKVEEEEENNNENEETKAIMGAGALGAVHPHPLLLTRCKSEPARTGERLNAEAILLRQTRLDVQPRSQQNS